jgi:hypothetical protein
MPASFITTVLDQEILPATPTYTNWFSNCHFLVFESDTVGDYHVTNQFLKVAVALYAQISGGALTTNIERQLHFFQSTINTHDLIYLRPEFRNDCFPFRLLINPSTGFHARILAISC